MWISKKKLYLQMQKIERNYLFIETEMARKWSVERSDNNLALLKKDVEFLNQQIAELKRALEG